MIGKIKKLIMQACPFKVSCESDFRRKEERKQVLADLAKSISILLFSTLAGYLFYSVGVSEVNIITIYLLGILILAVTTSRRIYSLIASVLSIIIFNFFFVSPTYTFAVYDMEYMITFFVMFVFSNLTGTLALNIKVQARQSEQIALRTQLLLDTNRLLQKEREIPSIMAVAAEQLIKLLKRDILLYRLEEGKLGEPELFHASDFLEKGEILCSIDGAVLMKEKKIAKWVFEQQEMAGSSTRIFADAAGMYVPLQSAAMVYGVVGVVMEECYILEPVERGLMFSILSECALIVENEVYRQKKQEAQMQAEQEKFRANLLRSVSHDLRTPLTSISGNAGILMNNEVNEQYKMRLYVDIYDDSMWLINLVENLLSVTRIENDTMNVHMQAELLEEIITEALKHVNRKSEEHQIMVDMEDDLQLVRVDSRLVIQVIINIVNNAVEYTQPGSEISIRTKKENHLVVVTIADNGPGIADDQKNRIFDMFYKAGNMAGDAHRGMGLGLALCKSIIKAHGGEIIVKDHKPTGVAFVFSLPAEEVAIHGQ